MGLGFQREGLNLLEQLGETLSFRQIRAQYQRIDQEAHDVFDFTQISVGDWRADADVGLAGVTEKKCIEG